MTSETNLDRTHPIPVEPEVAPAQASGPTDEVGEDDFDANEYVKNLIARMDGDESATIPDLRETTTAATSESSANPVKDSPSSNVTRPGEPSSATSQLFHAWDAEASDESDVVEPRRSRTPEQVKDLEQLREAANLTTSSALHTFDCKSLIVRCYTSLFMALMAVALSSALVLLSEHRSSFAFIASLLLFVMGVAATWRFFATTSVLWRKMAR